MKRKAFRLGSCEHRCGYCQHYALSSIPVLAQVDTGRSWGQYDPQSGDWRRHCHTDERRHECLSFDPVEPMAGINSRRSESASYKVTATSQGSRLQSSATSRYVGSSVLVNSRSSRAR